ncbi:MAG TPA: hypothetical protein VI819_00340 [Patescibacteria group bacterium]|nr:hypothetical protein [Patescibacteria group bacterium]
MSVDNPIFEKQPCEYESPTNVSAYDLQRLGKEVPHWQAEAERRALEKSGVKFTASSSGEEIGSIKLIPEIRKSKHNS